MYDFKIENSKALRLGLINCELVYKSILVLVDHYLPCPNGPVGYVWDHSVPVGI